MTHLPLSLFFYTKTCLPIRIARFSARFFRAKRVGLEQKIEPVCLDGLTRFSIRAWRARPKTGRASPGPGQAGRPVWPSLGIAYN
jgi:hypothetical protein